MNIFHRRPFAFSCFFLICGTLLGAFASDVFIAPSIAVLSIFAFISLVVSVIKRQSGFVVRIALPIFFAVLGILHSYLYDLNTQKDIETYSSDTEPSKIEATVLSVSYRSNYLSTFDIRAHSINDEKVDFKMRFEAPYLLDISEGDIISASVLISDIENDSSFDEKQYLNSKGIYFLATEPVPSIELADKKSDSLEIRLRTLNKSFCKIFKRFLDEDSASLVSALFLGNRDELDSVTKRDFKRTGCYHILALSGMHLAIISTMLDLLLTALRLKKGIRFVISPILIIFYVALSGFGLSVIRSAIMLIFAYAAFFLRSKKDSFTALLFAAAAIISFSPAAVRDIGFWMSVTATLGIIIASPFETLIRFKMRRFLKGFFGKIIRYCISGLIMSFSAIIMTLPFSCFCFGAISVMGPIVTLLLSPLISVVLYLAPLLLLLNKVPIIPDLISFVIDAFSHLSVGITGYFSKIERIYLSLDYPFVKYAVPIFFILLFILLTVKLKHKIIIPIFVLIFVIVFSVFEYRAINDDTTYVKYLRVKENEYLCLSKNGENSIIDISTGAFSGLYEAYTEALTLGYREIETVVLTHVHKKHVSSLKKLSERELLKSVIIPEPINDTERTVVESIKHELEKKGVKTVLYDAENDSVNINGSKINFSRDYIKRSSHPVISLEIKGETDILYIGSSYFEVETPQNTAENIILGTHGPICKRDFDLHTEPNTKLILIADEEISLYANITSGNETKIIKNSNKFCFAGTSQDK